jgi:hypothetical protein
VAFGVFHHHLKVRQHEAKGTEHQKEKGKYSETPIHRFRRGSEKETMDPGKR